LKPSDDIQIKEITKDKNAQTIKEICEVTGLSESSIKRHAQKMVETGKWTQVWKRQKDKTVMAFVRAK
jgi:DNA-binding MarR family transcriptional regulator